MEIVLGLMFLLGPLLVVLTVLASLGWLVLAALASLLWIWQRLLRATGWVGRAERERSTRPLHCI
jgi:hypothetical protein